jgi:esterase/lipase superfamily enzyme
MKRLKVLFLSTDPLPSDPHSWLWIDEEMQAEVRAAEVRDSLDFTSRWAERADDLLQALHEVRPDVVHFSGRGSSADGIILAGEDGVPRVIDEHALAEIFDMLKDTVRVVLLNASTQSQDEGISEVIDCVITIGRGISDDVATTFATFFYRALGFGRSVEEAFFQGRAALRRNGVLEEGFPRLRVRQGVDPFEIILVNSPKAPLLPADPDVDELTRGIWGGRQGVAYREVAQYSRTIGDALYRLWYATNRRPTGYTRPVMRGGDWVPPVSYGARLDDRVHVGSCDVVIPASHKIGELGSPWIRRVLTRTDDRLRLGDVLPMEAESFWTSVQDYAASFDPEHRHALVFIHGYRVSFKDAALRAAQLGYDLGVKGPVAFFSWPSRATLLGYPADGSAVEASEHAITEFLIRFVRDCGADRVHVIAHSMGNRPLLRALQRIVSAAESEDAVRFGHLVLAAPDLTRELFLDVADQYRRLSHRTTLYVSDQDRALRASFRLQGPRVGLAPPVTCAPGIDTVHVANVDRTLLGHSTFAEARPVLSDIHALLNFDAPPELRLGLVERRQGDERYWEVHA